MSDALELRGVTKRFGRIVAVDGLSLSVPEGSLFGLIGPNGAGKTTTFSLLAGFLRADAGEVLVRGEVLPAGVPRAGKLVALPQDASLPPRLRSLDCLVMLGRLGGLDGRTARCRAERTLDRLGVGGSIAGQRIGELSHGQRRRLQIAQTLLGEGEVILFDEPTSGLDSIAAAELRALIKDLRGERTIVLSSHNLAEVEAVCDRSAILAKGRLVSVGTMDELRRSTSRVRLLLVQAPGDPEGALKMLRAIDGVQSAARDPRDPRAIDLELADDGLGGADVVANEILKQLIMRGVGIRSIERGQSLEQRFLEEVDRGAPAV